MPRKPGKPAKADTTTILPKKGGIRTPVYDDDRVSVIEVQPGLSLTERVARARQFAKEATKKLKGQGRVDVGADIAELEYDYVRTGHPAIDYVGNGGLIRGRITQFWGPDGASKTTMLAWIIAQLQSRGMLCAIAPVEGMDKSWWRTLGVFVPYGADELDIMAKVAKKRGEADPTLQALAYNRHYEERGWAPLTVIQHQAGDYVLQLVYEMTKSNLYDLIGIDSLAVIKSSKILDEKDVTDTNQYGGEAPLIGRFCSYMGSALNTRYDEANNVSPEGRFANRTITVAINQARDTIGTMARAEHNKMHFPGGRALRHYLSQSFFFTDVEDFGDLENQDRFKVNTIYAKMFRVLGTKMRGGPEQRHARYTLHLKDNEHENAKWRAGQMDLGGTLRILAVQLGVVQQNGASYVFQGKKWHGKEAIDVALRKDKVLYQELYDAMLERAILDSRSGTIPSIGGA